MKVVCNVRMCKNREEGSKCAECCHNYDSELILVRDNMDTTEEIEEIKQDLEMEKLFSLDLQRRINILEALLEQHRIRMSRLEDNAEE